MSNFNLSEAVDGTPPEELPHLSMEEFWEAFRDSVLVNPEQYPTATKMMEKCFYAGAWAMLLPMIRLLEENSGTGLAVFLSERYQEVADFTRSVVESDPTDSEEGRD